MNTNISTFTTFHFRFKRASCQMTQVDWFLWFQIVSKFNVWVISEMQAICMSSLKDQIKKGTSVLLMNTNFIYYISHLNYAILILSLWGHRLVNYIKRFNMHASVLIFHLILTEITYLQHPWYLLHHLLIFVSLLERDVKYFEYKSIYKYI